MLPASQRCKDQTKKAPTGPLNRKKLLEFLERTAREQADWPEAKPYEAGIKRGKKMFSNTYFLNCLFRKIKKTDFW